MGFDLGVTPAWSAERRDISGSERTERRPSCQWRHDRGLRTTGERPVRARTKSVGERHGHRRRYVDAGQKGGAEGTRTPDPHTARPRAGCQPTSADVRFRRSVGRPVTGGRLRTSTDSVPLATEVAPSQSTRDDRQHAGTRAALTIPTYGPSMTWRSGCGCSAKHDSRASGERTDVLDRELANTVSRH